MNILLSIKPEFVNKILSHEKLYEFRKSIFKQKVERIYIYSTYPVKKIVGYFEVTDIICGSPEELWELFSDVFAIKIDNLVIFDEFIDMNMFDEFKAPQSFCYVENNDCLKELLLA